MVFLHRDNGGLEVLIKPVREGTRSEREKNRRSDNESHFQFAANLRP